MKVVYNTQGLNILNCADMMIGITMDLLFMDGGRENAIEMQAGA
jgi:hypothetical protein